MIGGPSFDSGAIPRYGDYDPSTDVSRGHAIRFASDDLYDCRWEVTHRYQLQKETPSGIYVGRFRFKIDGKPLKYHVTFIVRKAPDRPKAPILVLCSTNTWLAYSATPFAANAPDRQLWSTTGLPNVVPEAPSYSCYRNHHQGQPSYSIRHEHALASGGARRLVQQEQRRLQPPDARRAVCPHLVGRSWLRL